MIDSLEALAQSELTLGAAPPELARLSSIARERMVPARTMFLTCGAEANTVSLLAKGEVELEFPVYFQGKRRDVHFQTVGPGHALGWSALVPPHRLTMSARATMDTLLVDLPRDPFLEVLAATPELELVVMRNLTRLLAQRLQDAHGLWLMELQRTLPERLTPPSAQAFH
jgi:CRP-like cAMP-binding protein